MAIEIVLSYDFFLKMMTFHSHVSSPEGIFQVFCLRNSVYLLFWGWSSDDFWWKNMSRWFPLPHGNCIPSSWVNDIGIFSISPPKSLIWHAFVMMKPTKQLDLSPKNSSYLFHRDQTCFDHKKLAFHQQKWMNNEDISPHNLCSFPAWILLCQTMNRFREGLHSTG